MKETSASAEPTPSSIAELVPFFKAFCNGTRASIIEYLMTGEKCVCEITAQLRLSQPLISHHLAILRGAGFVTVRGEGARTYYAIDWQEFESQMASFSAGVELLRARDAGPSCACG